jgi:hypothetical protein
MLPFQLGHKLEIHTVDADDEGQRGEDTGAARTRITSLVRMLRVEIYPLLGLAVLAIGFVVPTLAQEGNTIDPQVRKQIEELNRKYDEASNANSAVAVAALFTVDAVETGPEGPGSGQPDIVQRYLALFQSHPTSHISKLAQLSQSAAAYAPSRNGTRCKKNILHDRRVSPRDTW